MGDINSWHSQQEIIMNQEQQIGGTYGRPVNVKKGGMGKWEKCIRFVAGLTEPTEFLTPLAENMPLIGKLGLIKETKEANAQGYKNTWGYFEDLGGQPFAVQLSNQLEGLLSKCYQIGDTVQMIYKGKVDFGGRPTHNWEVNSVDVDSQEQLPI